MLLSALLFGAAAGIAWRSLLLLQTSYGVSQVGYGALIVAMAALFVKESLFRYLLNIARSSKSTMMEANAWHARSDAVSSVVVVVGILGNLAGITILDPIAAIIVAGLLCRMGWKYGHSAFDALTDRADVGQLSEIRATLTGTQGVIAVHQVRTRRSGDRVVGDADVQVAPRLSVSEAHKIAATLQQSVLDQHGLADFVVHIDAETEHPPDQLRLPEREEILTAFRAVLPEGLELLDASPLHFLDGKVDADLLVRLKTSESPEMIGVFDQRVRALEGRLAWLRHARVFISFEA
jgi:cation diffusion facilitator family transporter